MDIAVDTNILIRDLWLCSQSIRLLLDFISRTDSRLLLGEIVIEETEAYFKRLLEQNLNSIKSAVRNASRNSIKGLPDIDYDTIFNNTYEVWKEEFHKILRKGTSVIIETESKILSDAIHRCIERIPPSKESGEGMRDVVIWLSFLAYCKKRVKTYNGYHVAFISNNTRDFADINDIKVFKPQLLKDIEGTNVLIDFYPSLEVFLDNQANKISHITVEWIQERINFEDIRELIESYLGDDSFPWRKPDNYFTIFEDKLRETYIISGTPKIYQLEVNLEDVKVFEFDDKHIEVSVEFYAYVEADINCKISESSFLNNYYDAVDIYKLDNKSERTLVVSHCE